MSGSITPFTTAICSNDIRDLVTRTLAVGRMLATLLGQQHQRAQSNEHMKSIVGLVLSAIDTLADSGERRTSLADDDWQLLRLSLADFLRNCAPIVAQCEERQDYVTGLLTKLR